MYIRHHFIYMEYFFGCVLSSLLTLLLLPTTHGFTSNLFREYIGADLDGIRFTDVPINPNVNFDYILSFAIDYTTNPKSPTPTNGKFNVFWYTRHLQPYDVASIKSQHRNVRIAVSIGGDAVTDHQKAVFAPKSISSWVYNAVESLTQIIKLYNLDGIDIDYEHFNDTSGTPEIFAECIGQVVTILKKQGVISFASIAPFDDQGPVVSHYKALWSKYGEVIDYVNFQFYAYNKITRVSEFVGLYKEQVGNFRGGQVLASFITDGTQGGLAPNQGFFEACRELKKGGNLGGIFVWSADDSKNHGFSNEMQAQLLMTS